MINPKSSWSSHLRKHDHYSKIKHIFAFVLCFSLAIGLFHVIKAEAEENKVVKNFKELQEAVNNGGTVVLGADINAVGSSLSVSGGKTVTILGNGHQISGGANVQINVIKGSVLYLGSSDGTDRLTLKGSCPQGSILSVEGKGSVATMYDGVTITDNYNYSAGSGGGVTVTKNAVFNMKGGTISDCSVAAGCNGGGVLAIENGTFNMSGGSIVNCTANKNLADIGGGVAVVSGDEIPGRFSMTGGKISNCSSGFGGGVGIYESNARITGGFIQNCSAAVLGGGLFVGEGNADISGDTVICNNIVPQNSYKGGGSDICVYPDENSSVTLPAIHNKWPEYQNTGFRINGWFQDYGNNRYSYPSNITSQVEGNAKQQGYACLIAAISSEVNYTLNYDANGGSGAPSGETKAGRNSADFNISSIEPTRDGFRFLGWADSNEAGASGKYHANDKVTVTNADENNTKTLYAVWASDDEYILNFDANGGTDAPSTQHSRPKENESSVTFAIPDDIPTREGYTFLGWSENNKNEEADFNKGGTFTMSEETTGKTKTLYAVWISNEIAEKKKEVPAVEKKVWNERDNRWRDTTFAGVNGCSSDSSLYFKITGTMPENLEEYYEDQEDDTTVAENNENAQIQENESETDTSDMDQQNSNAEIKSPVYSSYTDYKFTDTYENGITPDISKLRVYLYNGKNSTDTVNGMTTKEAGENAVDITDLFDVTNDTSDRRIEINLKKSGVTAADGTTGAVDLKKTYALNGVTVSFHGNSKIVVYYPAKLNSNAAVGPAGNANMATLEFRNANGEYLTDYTPPDTVRVFTFKLQVKKWKDAIGTENGGSSLQDASFILYKGSKSDKNIVATGKSDANGTVNFSNLTTIGTGSYILEETESPAGYNRMSDVTVDISATTDDPSVDPKLKSVSIRVTGGEATSSISDDSTQININVVNKAGLILPNTGGIGTKVFYAAGVCLIACAIGLLLARRKK